MGSMEALQVRILYFADAARRVGTNEELLELPRPATLGEVQAALYRRHPSLEELQDHLLWSVDEEMAVPGTLLGELSVVGVLPPFSGG